MHTSLVLAQSASNTFTDYISSLPMIIEVDDSMVLFGWPEPQLGSLNFFYAFALIFIPESWLTPPTLYLFSFSSEN